MKLAKDNGNKCGFENKAYCEINEYCSPHAECGPKLTHRARGTPWYLYSGIFLKAACEKFAKKKEEEDKKK